MKTLILIGKFTALISFSIGSILLILYFYLGGNYEIENVGLMFVVIAFIVNSILLIILLISCIISSQYRIDLLKTCGLILLNIPIAIGYFIIFLNIIDVTNDF